MPEYAIGRREIALMYEREELRRRGIESDLRAEDALTLIREALRGESASGWQDMDVDIFLSPKALLLIARKADGKEYCFSFTDGESLIRGCCACALHRGTLYWFDDRFHLIIHTADESLISPLREFSVGENAIAGDYLREHGTLLLAGTAVQTMKDAFAKKTV